MKFSLVLATVHRVQEVERLLQSLQNQTYKDFEVILVDQNLDGRLDALVKQFSSSLCIMHLQSLLGLSIARNYGLQNINGEIVAFPDDDCWYPDDLLACIHSFLISHPLSDGLTCISKDADKVISSGRFRAKDCLVTKANVWNTAISYTIFLRTRVIKTVGNFDIGIGVGSGTMYGAGEETDYLIRAISFNFNINFTSRLFAYHPNSLTNYNDNMCKKAYSYSCGHGYLLKKHKYPLYFKLYILMRPLVGMFLSAIKGDIPKSRYYWHSLCGRFVGITSTP